MARRQYPKRGAPVSAQARPLLLDLFCGAGGAAQGYADAGFEVVGVDMVAQPHYPFVFRQGDALECLDTLLSGRAWGGYRLSDFAIIHASPPCQAHSRISKNLGYASRHADFLPATRARLMASGVPWVMENVSGAPMPAAIVLCGSMFGLGISELGWYVQRHRQFECSHLLFARQACRHKGLAISVTGTGTPKPILDKLGRAFTRDEARRLLDISWMTRGELSQAIPPAYTRWIGAQLRAAIVPAQGGVA